MKNTGAGVKRILVVEDEPGINQVCLRVLTSEGFEVDIAVNGEVAQDMLGEKDYDLCLIDIRTPIMNGKQLYQCIQEKHPELIDGVVFTTGDVMGGDTQSFLQQSGRPFLPKPFTPDQLKIIIRETLRQLEKWLQIVDDEEAIRRLLYQKLSSEGYQCQEAGSAEQALDKLGGNMVELVFSDIKMPGKSGVELLPEIKASYLDTVVIMATAITETSTTIQCMKQGAYDYITKPFTHQELLDVINQFLPTSWTHRLRFF